MPLCWLSGLMDNLVLVKSDKESPAARRNQWLSKWHATYSLMYYDETREGEKIWRNVDTLDN